MNVHQPETESKSKVTLTKTQIHICIQGASPWDFLMDWESVFFAMLRMCRKKEDNIVYSKSLLSILLKHGDTKTGQKVYRPKPQTLGITLKSQIFQVRM